MSLNLFPTFLTVFYEWAAHFHLSCWHGGMGWTVFSAGRGSHSHAGTSDMFLTFITQTCVFQILSFHWPSLAILPIPVFHSNTSISFKWTLKLILSCSLVCGWGGSAAALSEFSPLVWTSVGFMLCESIHSDTLWSLWGLKHKHNVLWRRHFFMEIHFCKHIPFCYSLSNCSQRITLPMLGTCWWESCQ